MKANPRHPFWGKQKEEETGYELRHLCGIMKEKYLGSIVKAETKELDGRTTARQYMQHRINEHENSDLPLPKKLTEGEPPEKPNVFSDGSVKTPRKQHAASEGQAHGGQGEDWKH